MHRHVDALVFARRRLTSIPRVQEEGTASTALLATTVPLRALPGLAMADKIGPVAVGIVQGLENHDRTQSGWG
jgi:hypothetical protein